MEEQSLSTKDEPKSSSSEVKEKIICDQSQMSEYLNNLCSGINSIHAMISNLLKERDRIFEQVCSIAVEMGGFKLAWVGIIDPKTLWVKPVAKAGDMKHYIDQIVVSVNPDLPEGQGMSGQAIQSNHYVIVNNFLQETSVARWHHIATNLGINSAGVFPIRQGKHPIGVLKFFAEQKDFFYSDLIELLDIMARQISYALDKLRYRKMGNPPTFTET